MIAATVCSGIGAPEVAMPHWQWAFASEIEAAPRAIMAYRHGAEDARHARQGTGPALWGDFTAIRVRFLRRLGVTLPQWLVAGTPCQSFSIAGLRGGLSDARGNLTLEFLRLVHALRRAGSLRGFLWENVPGVLSHPDNPFGCFLAGIVGSDTPIVSPLKRGRWPSAGMVDGPFGKAAWRVSDAQYFGLAQRRARVILVASFVGGGDPAAVLFERRGVPGNHPPRREQGQGVAVDVAPSLVSSGRGVERTGETRGQDPVVACFGGGNTSGSIDKAACLTAKGQRVDFEVETFVTHALRAEGFDASEDGTGRGTPIVPVDLTNGSIGVDVAGTIEHAQHKSNRGQAVLTPIAFDCKGTEVQFSTDGVNPPLRSMGHKDGHSNAGGHAAIAFGMGVRRLMPVECERLQGFPDHFTAIPSRWRKVPSDEAAHAVIEGRFADGEPGGDLITDCLADSPRYKALGNSMPVPVIRFYLERVERQAAA